MKQSQFETTTWATAKIPTIAKKKRRSFKLSKAVRNLGAAGAGVTACYVRVASGAPISVPINQDLTFASSSIPQSYSFDLNNDSQTDVELFSSDFGGKLALSFKSLSAFPYFDTTAFDEVA